MDQPHDRRAKPVILKPLVAKQYDSCKLATARINIWEGSVRSSKTVSSLIRWLEFIRQGPAGNLLMVGKTERTLKRNIIDPIVEWLGAKRARYVQGMGELWILGRRIYTIGANDERSQERIRGMTLAGAYVDEATTIPESFWSMLMSRLSIDDAQIFATTNPDSKQHWFKIKWLDRCSTWLQHDGQVLKFEGDERLDLNRFSFNLDDNKNLSAEYVSNLKREYVGLWYRRFIAGEWVAAEGAVYDMFDEDKHVVQWAQIPQITRWAALGIDHGTRNAFAAVLIGLAQGKAYVVDEWRWDSKLKRKQLTNPEYSKLLQAWLRDYQRPGEASGAVGINVDWVCVDPSAADFKLQMHQDGWSNIANANNEVLDGIQAVSGALAQDWLRVSDRCTGLLDEFPSYSWDEKAETDKVIKQADHSLDALRYGLATTRWGWRDLILTK